MRHINAAGSAWSASFEIAICDFKEEGKDMSKPKRSRNVTTSRKARSGKAAVVPVGRIDRSILLIRGEKVILDADLAVCG